MTARTYVMTGGSAGFGRRAVALMLSEHPDLHLVLLVRGLRGPALVDALGAEANNANVSAIACDLASLHSVRAAGEELQRRLDDGSLPPLAGFVGNGGVVMSSRTTSTRDGYETTFAVNVLSHALLLHQLLGRFTSGARVVLTGSGSHWGDRRHNLFQAPPQWDTVENLATPGAGPDPASSVRAGGRAYSTSKLATIYLVHALARRLPEPAAAYTFNPDLVTGTGIVRDARPVVRLAFTALTPVFRATRIGISPNAAGHLLADVAAGPQPGPTGSYVERRGITPSSPASYDTDREENLWAESARLTGTTPSSPLTPASEN